uniref:Uncharacterized protein n=1 Tax=Triticum urartu TaxID=4572 RepID=A0A8R7PNY3_TRIUA
MRGKGAEQRCNIYMLCSGSTCISMDACEPYRRATQHRGRSNVRTGLWNDYQSEQELYIYGVRGLHLNQTHPPMIYVFSP